MKYNIECKLIWDEFLEKTKNKFDFYIPKIYKNNEYGAVIIEPREHKNLLTVLKSTMYHLNENDSKTKWGLQIFHGKTNEKYIKDVTKNWGQIEYTNLGVENLTNEEHSQLMETSGFWEKVVSERALIFQTDSLLLRSGIDEFLTYDYIGAPWMKPKENQLVGNGGLSLRNVKKMIEICDNNTVEEQIWEDIYFVKHLRGEGVADVDTAKRFCMEDVFSPNPLGVHNPIRHINPEQLKKVLYKI